ncbi:hypothetical protein [Paraburkholderia youngii]|uniref:hypothetical protein n=1 Tax=Paraburkholderia youngii TaxID=2782701 RepID=UPI003D1F2631
MKRIATALSFAVATAALGTAVTSYAQAIPAVAVEPIAVQATVVRVRYVGPFDTDPVLTERGASIATGRGDVEVAVRLSDGELCTVRVDGARQPRIGTSVTLVSAGDATRLVD